MNVVRDEWNNLTSGIRSKWHESGDIAQDIEDAYHKGTGAARWDSDPVVKKQKTEKGYIPTSVNLGHRDFFHKSRMPYRRTYRRRYRRRGLAYRRRYRRMAYRRRRTWGKRVRRAALRSHMSKRLEWVNSSTTPELLQQNTTSIKNFVTVDRLSGAAVTILDDKTKRQGWSINARGLKLNYWFKNILGTNAIYVRMIVYEKLTEKTDTGLTGFIFKTDDSETTATITQWVSSTPAKAPWMSMNAAVDKKKCRVHKDIKFKLAAVDQADAGTDTRHVKLWIPLKNRLMKFNVDTAADVSDVDWTPLVMVYACSADQLSHAPDDILSLSTHAVFYFKDP